MKIGIVNDVPLAVEAMRRILAATRRHQVIWTAPDGVEAVRQCARQLPDLVLMDLVMPHMDGVQATREIMQQYTCAILVVTASIEGHADPRGSEEANLKLSQARAESVREYLLASHGVAAERVTAVGKGSSALMKPNEPAAPENRRVTIVANPG